MVGASGEVEFRSRRLCGIAIGGADIFRADGPNAIDRERLSGGILQQAVKFSGREIIGGDKSAGLRSAAARELGNQQIVAEASEVERSQSHTPRSIEPIAMLEAT